MNMGVIDEIRTAAKNRVLIRIEYIDSKSNTTSRTLEPYELRDDSLFGFDIEKDAIRNFKLNQILNVSVTKIPYIAKWPVQI